MSAHRHKSSGGDDEELFSSRLPAACLAALDAEGTVRGKTFRDFCKPGRTPVNAALSWCLWRRMMPPEPEFQLESEVPS